MSDLPRDKSTVTPVMRDYPTGPLKMVLYDRWSFIGPMTPYTPDFGAWQELLGPMGVGGINGG